MIQKNKVSIIENGEKRTKKEIVIDIENGEKNIWSIREPKVESTTEKNIQIVNIVTVLITTLKLTIN